MVRELRIAEQTIFLHRARASVVLQTPQDHRRRWLTAEGRDEGQRLSANRPID